MTQDPEGAAHEGHDEPPLLQRLALTSVYPPGFIVCVMAGTELFTEHTATAVYPVLDGRARIIGLLCVWIVVGGGSLLVAG